ncbi:MarR family winged helix-turn-helix transcriptional regulator [Maricaulis salignorans]|uniref:MarR family winged helix-turn-helix transcriptional regulator n=1 Tax=Maricaulis salignorans TaxID=144026 RepID=UPI003A8E9274
MKDFQDIAHGKYAPGFFGLLALRVVGDIEADGGILMRRLGLAVPPRSVSALLLLADGPLSVTEIAQQVGMTHAAVIKNVRKLLELGLAERGEDEHDDRRKPLHLTAAGVERAAAVARFMREAANVYQALFDEIGIDMFEGMSRMEQALKRKSFAARFNLPDAETR